MSKFPEITVHGWHKSGPVYTYSQKLSGWRNRRNREQLVEEGKRGGRNIQTPEHAVLWSGPPGEVLALNKGHRYRITVELLTGDHAGEHAAFDVDATNQIEIKRLGESIKLLNVEALRHDAPSAEEIMAQALADEIEGDAAEDIAEALEYLDSLGDAPSDGGDVEAAGDISEDDDLTEEE